MHVTEINIIDLPPLGEVYFKCDERVNLFIGPNASGKSTILRAMNSAWSGVLERSSGGDGELAFRSEKSIANVLIYLSEDWPRDDVGNIIPDTLILDDTVPLFYAPTTRVSLPQQDIFDQTATWQRSPFNSESPSGGKFSFSRSRLDRSYEKPENADTDDPLKGLFHTSSGMFQGQYVELAIDWLLHNYFDGAPGMQEVLHEVVNRGYSCTKSICPEILYGKDPQGYAELNDDDGIHLPERAVHYGMGILTRDGVWGELLYAGDLSSGTQGTLLWVWALALKLAYHYDWGAGWEEKPAILLIDEIENHLHPTWQRRVIPALLEHFPGLQIFATTHSPFMVAGLKMGQVHLLKRDEDGSVTATTNERDVIGWTADEILRNMMGVEEPTDQLTVDRANRLRLLREKETLTPEEEAELNRLRRQVNEDLLAKGGPLEVERERYADLMRSFLLSRQSDLTQDGE